MDAKTEKQLDIIEQRTGNLCAAVSRIEYVTALLSELGGEASLAALQSFRNKALFAQLKADDLEAQLTKANEEIQILIEELTLARHEIDYLKSQ